jgi:hypothetical protein
MRFTIGRVRMNLFGEAGLLDLQLFLSLSSHRTSIRGCLDIARTMGVYPVPGLYLGREYRAME